MDFKDFNEMTYISVSSAEANEINKTGNIIIIYIQKLNDDKSVPHKVHVFTFFFFLVNKKKNKNKNHKIELRP